MQLLSLTLDGFKSFAQKTTIKFEPGMTGIVGPNGSGKSNIIEAIQWVLGEQSAHQLRGDRMADVIFNGSADRKPLNRALVAVTLDNSDHYLASDFTELTITRKLYRNGDSEYLINDQQVRLKDITDLFIDSGLGRESFSIISQGRIEAIFNGKSADRRLIIETVAGVAKYKKNKQAAEKRLAATMENLNRVNDIISELETQLEPLAEESALAQDYQEQKQQFDLLDRTQTVHQYDREKESLTGLDEQLTKATTMVNDYQRQAKEDNQQLLVLKQQRQQLLTTKDQLQATILEQTQIIAKLNNQQSVASVRREQQLHEQARLEKQEQEIQANLAGVKQQLESTQNKITQQLEAIDERQAELKNVQQLSSKERLEQLNQQLGQLRDQQVTLMQRLTTLKNQQTYLAQNHEQTLSQHRQSATELDNVQDELDRTTEKLTVQQDASRKLKQQVDQQTTTLHQEEQRYENLVAKYQQRQQKWYQLLGDVNSTKSRIKAYHSMANDYSGYYRGVQSVLRQRQRFAGLAGAVSELLDVPAKYTQAIETVLGGQLQQLVVDRQITAKAIINFLIKSRSGRVTILPLDTLSHRRPLSLWPQLAKLPGYLGKATDLINYDPQYQLVADYLLGTTVIADNLDHATAIARAGRHLVRVVTLDGQLINASGAMTGGATSRQKTGLLKQKQLAKELQSTLEQQQQQAQQLEQEVARLKAAQSASHQLINQQQAKLQQQQTALHQQQAECQLLATQQENLDKQLNTLKGRTAQQDSANQSYQEQVAANQEATKEASKQLAAVKDKMTTTANQITDLQTDSSAKAEQVYQMQQWLAVANERLQQTQQKQTELGHQEQLLKSNLAGIATELTKINGQLNNQVAGESTAVTLKAAEKKLRAAKQGLADQRLEFDQLEEKLSRAEAHYERLRELQRAAVDNKNELTAQKVKCEAQIDQCLNRLSEQYSMTIAEARQNLSSLDEATLATKLKLLKRGLDDLGDVNVGSIEEYQRVKERYDFLKGQQDDLLAARKQLSQTMGEMDDQVKDRFIQTFNQVSEKFNETFQQIFNGGQAKLILTDPHDLLTTGVDIMAQPPGKKNQHLSLLSGGERALTAITLLFAILKVRPVPFAILDEPEAALDDVNVQRFANYLNHFGTTGPQFIVITHRKGTMMGADVLYGVTMQESGVSKMVSVDVIETLEEVGN